MRLAFALLLAAALVVLGSSEPSSRGRAASPAAARGAGVAPAAPRPVGPTGVVLPPSDPLALEMQRELDRAQQAYAESFRRLADARDDAEAFAVQEDMRQQRVEMQVTLLSIQAGYARRAGRHAYAEALEHAIAALISADPPRPDAPAGRGGM